MSQGLVGLEAAAVAEDRADADCGEGCIFGFVHGAVVVFGVVVVSEAVQGGVGDVEQQFVGQGVAPQGDLSVGFIEADDEVGIKIVAVVFGVAHIEREDVGGAFDAGEFEV